MSSPIRDSQIYVQRKTVKRLWLIAHAEKVVPVAGQNQISTVTGDEVGDRLLNQLIERDYPDVIAAEKEIEGIQEKLGEKLRAKKNETDRH